MEARQQTASSVLNAIAAPVAPVPSIACSQNGLEFGFRAYRFFASRSRDWTEWECAVLNISAWLLRRAGKYLNYQARESSTYSRLHDSAPPTAFKRFASGSPREFSQSSGRGDS